MTAGKAHLAMMRRLKKQVTVLKRKEKSSRNKLRAALSKVKKFKKSCDRKLDQQSKVASQKTSVAVASVYARLAATLKRKAKVRKVAPKKSAAKLAKSHKAPKRRRSAKRK